MTGTIGIGEVVEACVSMEQRNLALFRALGERVADEPDPVTQRWFAVASQRHAWHAELWDERRPRIPVETGSSGTVAVVPPTGVTRDWYRHELEQMLTDLDELSARVDRTLDPSTARVISLVRADLLELAHG